MTSCAKAFGYCASKHLKLVLDKLEALLMTEGSSKRSRGGGLLASLGLKMDSRSETETVHARCTILRCVGEVAANVGTGGAGVDDNETLTEFRRKTDEICQKFVMPAIKSAHPSLKLSALRASSDIAKVCQKSSSTAEEVVLGKPFILITLYAI